MSSVLRAFGKKHLALRSCWLHAKTCTTCFCLYKQPFYVLHEGCATRGPWAKSVPWAEVSWPLESSRFQIQCGPRVKNLKIYQEKNNLLLCQAKLCGRSTVNSRSLTHAVAARGPNWSCAFGPSVLHGCTPLHETFTFKLKQPSCAWK